MQGGGGLHFAFSYGLKHRCNYPMCMLELARLGQILSIPVLATSFWLSLQAALRAARVTSGTQDDGPVAVVAVHKIKFSMILDPSDDCEAPALHADGTDHNYELAAWQASWGVYANALFNDMLETTDCAERSIPVVSL
eukprot:2594114-Amphidinium_carterae.1